MAEFLCFVALLEQPIPNRHLSYVATSNFSSAPGALKQQDIHTTSRTFRTLTDSYTNSLREQTLYLNRSVSESWYAWQDSNLRPFAPE